MKKTFKISAIVSLLILILIFISFNKPDMPEETEIEKNIEELLSKMSLEEKIGQTAQRGMSSWKKGEITEELREDIRNGRIGSFLNVMNKDHVEELQQIAIEESPNGIPILFGRDVIHGFRTIFPIPLGLSATWNPELVEKAIRISAIEATTNGIRWTFAPMLDICRDPRWGRIAESPGEDPYLGSQMAKAYVKGFQGGDLSDLTSIAACAKHFAGYGAAEGGRDYNTAVISEQLLRDIYLKPFKAANDANVSTYMSSFNEINGVPSSGNYFLLQQVLRDEWGFDGFVVSDWESIIEMITHGFCEDEKDAAKKAAIAGLNMEMVSRSYEKHLKELIEEGIIPESRLDEMVKQILRIKFRLGLFDNPNFDRTRDDVVLSTSHLEKAKQAAIQSMVLLKNKDNILPLSKSIKKIALIGPMCDAPHDQLGTWSFDGKKEDTRTPLLSLTAYLETNKIIYEPALMYSRDKGKDKFNNAIEAASQADVVLFFGGEEAIITGEAHSRAYINLPGAQDELITELHKTGKPIILVVMAGRPITFERIIDKVDAIIMAWHPGTMGGPAITDVLFGMAEPSGRLPVSWPKTVGQIPIHYNHKNTGRPPREKDAIPMDDIPFGTYQTALGNKSYYLDVGYKPQFPFGYGLGYTTFKYSNLKLSKEVIHLGKTITISVDVINTGKREGTEVVQLYTQDLVGDITRPVKELKGFQKISLKPGEKKNVSFTIHTDDLAFHNQKMELVTEPGKFKVWVGPNSAEGLESEFEIK